MSTPEAVKIPDTHRLRFRLLDQNDGDLLFELDQDPEVMRFINGGKLTTKEDIATVYLPRMKKYTNPEKGWGIWGVFDKHLSSYLGWILVRPMYFFSNTPDWDTIELGWRFKRSAWGKGFATEAARAVMKGVQSRCAVQCFSAIADPDNKASIAVMKKLGMQYFKRELIRDTIGNFDVVVYRKNCSDVSL